MLIPWRNILCKGINISKRKNQCKHDRRRWLSIDYCRLKRELHTKWTKAAINYLVFCKFWSQMTRFYRTLEHDTTCTMYSFQTFIHHCALSSFLTMNTMTLILTRKRIISKGNIISDRKSMPLSVKLEKSFLLSSTWTGVAKEWDLKKNFRLDWSWALITRSWQPQKVYRSLFPSNNTGSK